jgi:hypothetical protein
MSIQITGEQIQGIIGLIILGIVVIVGIRSL